MDAIKPMNHVIITGKEKDRKKHRLMDRLYKAYKKEKDCIGGFAMLPMIQTIRHHEQMKFHVFYEQEVVSAWCITTVLKFDNVKNEVPAITFIWIDKKLRGKGYFKAVIDQIESLIGKLIIDQPNAACGKSMTRLSMDNRPIVEHYNEGPLKTD
jgi:hypothetical protein